MVYTGWKTVQPKKTSKQASSGGHPGPGIPHVKQWIRNQSPSKVTSMLKAADTDQQNNPSGSDNANMDKLSSPTSAHTTRRPTQGQVETGYQ